MDLIQQILIGCIALTALIIGGFWFLPFGKVQNHEEERKEIKKLHRELVESIEEASMNAMNMFEEERRKQEALLLEINGRIEQLRYMERKNIQGFQPKNGLKTREEKVRELHEKGKNIDEIATEIKEYRGVVQTLINLQKNKP